MKQIKAVQTPGCFKDSSWQLIENENTPPLAMGLKKEFAEELARRWNNFEAEWALDAEFDYV